MDIDFTFSDTIAGYVTESDPQARTFGLRTADGREFAVRLTEATYAEVLRNLGEPYQAPGGALETLLTPGRYLYACCVFYPEDGTLKAEAKRIVVGRRGGRGVPVRGAGLVAEPDPRAGRVLPAGRSSPTARSTTPATGRS